MHICHRNAINETYEIGKFGIIENNSIMYYY